MLSILPSEHCWIAVAAGMALTLWWVPGVSFSREAFTGGG